MGPRIPDDVKTKLVELEQDIKRLRIQYDQYFMGVQKREPMLMRQRVEKFLKRSGLDNHRAAAVRFKYLNLVARFNTFAARWDRVLRMMEEGTFDRNAYRGFKPRVPRPDLDEAKETPTKKPPKTDVDGESDKSAGRVRAYRAPRDLENVEAEMEMVRATAPMPVEQMKTLFDEYVGLREEHGEDTSRVTFRSFAKSISKTHDSLKKKTGRSNHTFGVKVKDGKVALVVKKSKA